jgi:hypothetical protein
MISNVKGKTETKVGDLCKKIAITRQTLYRHVAPDGSLRDDGKKLLAGKQIEVCFIRLQYSDGSSWDSLISKYLDNKHLLTVIQIVI